MKAVKLIIILLIPVLVISSCDSRGKISTGIPEYEIVISAMPTSIALFDSSEISVEVTEYVSNEQLAGVLVKFYAIDFGSVTSEMLTSSVNASGLENPVYFYPEGYIGSGTARIVGQSIGSDGEYTDSDTVTVEVHQ